jgi:uncharacterized protein YaiL (DUF2058 family)
MSDSLRDQLIAAGYKAPKEEKKKQNTGKNKKKKSGRKNARPPAATGKKAPSGKQPSAGTGNEAEIAERKKLKAEIKTLIDAAKLSDWKGETVYRYLVDSRIRELYVKDEVQNRLAARELAITRLNGDTYVVPRDTALAIRKINPQWSVFNLEEQTGPVDEAEEYSEYKVPDDLKW